MAAETDFLIIPGIEVSSPEGHIVALNVPEPVSGRLSSHEIVDRIHVAGGIAGACHPSAL
jgi:hypothetical protein